MTAGQPVTATTLTVFWRPGCGYCRRLKRALARNGVSYQAVNIWEDESARAFVRSVASRNETVPTVRLAEDVMVNPKSAVLLEKLKSTAPELVGVARPTGRLTFWRRRD